MAFTRVTAAADNVSNLPNKPNENGYSAATLKAVFDAIGAALKTYINDTLLEELEGTSAAGNIGITTITGMTADDVQEALEELKTLISNTAQGNIPDGSITTAKLASSAVTTAKIADAAVGSAKLAVGAVTNAKLASNAVKNANIEGSAVTTDKINPGAVNASRLASSAVTTEKIANNAVTYGKLDSHAVRYRYSSSVIPQTAWSTSNTYSAYPYRASIPITQDENPANFEPHVTFSCLDAYKGIFAPVADSHSGGVYIYANALPSSAVHIDSVELWR